MKSYSVIRTLALAISVIAFCAVFGSRAFAEDAAVKIDNFTFNPQALTVHVGTAVTFTNNDDIPPVVAEKNNKFRSPALDTGQKFTQKFTQAGTVDYYCAIHPHMVGKIIVVP